MTHDATPHVIICGGGPSGLLASILLHNIGIPSTIVERSVATDAWNTRSYTIVLGERGCASLKRAGTDVYDKLSEAGLVRRSLYLYDGKNGSVRAMPKKVPGIGFSRPLLVDCLEETAANLPNITIQKGAGVSNVQVCRCENGEGEVVKVHLDDGSCILGTHAIGADGKWSKTRQSFPSLKAQGEIITCASWGVHMISPTTPSGEEWKRDGTYIIKPASGDETWYVIAAPLPEGGNSITVVVYDSALERYPWLEPPGSERGEGSAVSQAEQSWEEEYSAMPSNETNDAQLSDRLECLLREELPTFVSSFGTDMFKTARVNRRVSWLKMSPGEEEGEVTFAAEDGRIALIGDSCHCMTPSMGEGCNVALESAVKLIDAIVTTEKEHCSVKMLSEAFVRYGSSRPEEVRPIQEMSAERNFLKQGTQAVGRNLGGGIGQNPSTDISTRP